MNTLRTYLDEKGITLSIIEISGTGSPYSFSGNSKGNGSGWHCLYPDRRMEDIPAEDAVSRVDELLDRICPDIVMGGAIAYPSGAAVIRWASRNKKHVIIFDDARLDDIRRPFYVDWIKRQIYSIVDAMLIPAPSHNYTYNYFGISNDRLFYGVNAVDNEFFKNNLTGTIGIYTDALWSYRNGSQFGLKFSLYMLVNSKREYTSQNTYGIFPVTFFSMTFHGTIKKFTGFMQGNFGTKAASFQIGTSYRLSR